MKRYFPPLRILILLFIAGLGCGGGTQGALESAEFKLDSGNFADAIDLLLPIVEKDPTNFEAVEMLASATFGLAFFPPGTNGLDFFERYFSASTDSASRMQAIRSATPSVSVERASKVLDVVELLDTIPLENQTPETFFLRGLIDLGIISYVAVVIVNALESEDPCSYNFSAADQLVGSRFRQSLVSVNDNFARSGLEQFNESPLGVQLLNLNTTLEIAPSLIAFLIAEYGAEACP